MTQTLGTITQTLGTMTQTLGAMTQTFRNTTQTLRNTTQTFVIHLWTTQPTPCTISNMTEYKSNLTIT